jgi:glutathione synthase
MICSVFDVFVVMYLFSMKINPHSIFVFHLSSMKEWLETNKKAVMGENYTPDASITEGVPENLASTKLTNAMNVAHERYIHRFKPKHPVAILFVVQEGETNTVDQRILEFNLWTNHKVPVIRMSLTKAKSLMQMDSETGALYILPDVSADGENGFIPTKYEISVAYFRAGYAPTDYPDGYDGIEWDSRERIERSRATKCPSLGYHLAGTKKVQQELARSGTLERFFTDQEISDGIVTSMRAAFAGLYSLGNDTLQEDLDAVKDAITGNDSNYVLKPQREGGGYNYYGEQLAEKLKANVDDSGDALKLGDDLAEFILMQRLFPPKQTAVLLRAGMVEGTNESISELGCFGAIVQSHDGETLHNEYSGFLLRTKFSNVNEGGVASGFATLSSPYLC